MVSFGSAGTPATDASQDFAEGTHFKQAVASTIWLLQYDARQKQILQ